MKSYSYSALDCFEKCPQQYKFKYITRLNPLCEYIEAFMGRRVHEVLERLYKDLDIGKLNSLEELLENFKLNWKNHWNEDIKVVKKEYTFDDYRYLGERCISNYYHQHFPFVESETIGLEEKFQFHLEELNNQFQFTGFIDRLARGYDGVLEIHDYKTGLSFPGMIKLNEDRQLGLYNLAVKNRFPNAEEIRVIWHFLAFDKKVSLVLFPEKLNKISKELLKTIYKLENTFEFSPRETVLCKWCGYRSLCLDEPENNIFH